MIAMSVAKTPSSGMWVFTFSYRKANVTKFDLVVKKVKVDPVSSFEHTMMEMSPQCCIQSFAGPLVPEKIFERFFFTIYEHGGHLGHVTSIISTIFHFYLPKRLHTKFC